MIRRPFRFVSHARTATLMGLLTSTQGCGDGREHPSKASADEDWQLAAQSYPFIGAHGEMVCAEWRRHTGRGLTAVQREWYDIEKLNDELVGRRPLDAGVRAAVIRAGVGAVHDCESARRMTDARLEYLESQASFDPATPDPGVEADDIDKVRDGHLFDHWPTVRLRARETSNRSTLLKTGRLGIDTIAAA
jgi:hypothetical protein